MEKPITINKIKRMKYPSRQDMREAIWWLIDYIEKVEEKEVDCDRIK